MRLKPGEVLYLTREEWNYMQEKAREPILVEREKTHGSFERNAQVFAKLTEPMSNDQPMDTRHRLALIMICVKIARIISGSSRTKDHWTDIAGYAKLGEEACDN